MKVGALKKNYAVEILPGSWAEVADVSKRWDGWVIVKFKNGAEITWPPDWGVKAKTSLQKAADGLSDLAEQLNGLLGPNRPR